MESGTIKALSLSTEPDNTIAIPFPVVWMQRTLRMIHLLGIVSPLYKWRVWRQAFKHLLFPRNVR
jgi:hypothetical protein